MGGSGCSPCGYNEAYEFGICLGYNSLTGMNCDMDWRMNSNAITEATCKIYDAVLSVVGGPRLDCRIPDVPGPQEIVTCEWLDRDREFHGPHPKSGPNTEGKTPRFLLKHKRAQLLGQTLEQLEAQARLQMPQGAPQSLVI